MVLEAAPPLPRSASYTPYGGTAKVWQSRAREVLHDGPAGTGKTRGLLEKAHLSALKYPGCRILLTRKTRTSMSQSVLVTYEQKVLHPSELRWFGRATRSHRSTYLYPNGSEVAVIGMDNADRIMSTEWDRVFAFEATELIEEDWEKLTTRLRNGRTAYHQAVADCNPGPPQHWLLNRANLGSMLRIPSRHTDNPYLYDQRLKCWTQAGLDYMDTLRGLTGTRRRRLLDGIWCADESSVFDLDILLAHRNEHGDQPWHTGALTCEHEGKLRDTYLRKKKTEIVRWKEGDGIAFNEWKLWCDLYPDPKNPGRYRPHQSIYPVLAADVSWGQGASNSVICVGDRMTGRKIAEFASAQMAPEEFARQLVMAGLWFGGVKGHGFLGWEYNGPGQSLTRIIGDTLEYPWCYEHTSRRRGVMDEPPKATLGWVSNRESKIDLALALRDAYAGGDFINPSTAAIDETMTWIRYPSGGIGPAAMAEESPEAQQTHGDRTIADMLLKHLMEIAPMYVRPTRAEAGSIADREAQEMVDEEDDEE